MHSSFQFDNSAKKMYCSCAILVCVFNPFSPALASCFSVFECVCGVWILGFVCFILFFSLAECYWHCYTVKHQHFSTAAVVLHYARAVPMTSTVAAVLHDALAVPIICTVAAVLHYVHPVSTVNSNSGS